MVRSSPPRSSSAFRCSTSISRSCRDGAARRHVERAILAGDPRDRCVDHDARTNTRYRSCASPTANRDWRADSGAGCAATLATLGATALVEVLANSELLENPTPQAGEATYAEKLTKETFHLKPAESVALAARTVRLGGAYFFVDGKRIAVMRASTCQVEHAVEAGRRSLRRIAVSCSSAAMGGWCWTRFVLRAPRRWMRARGGGDFASSGSRGANPEVSDLGLVPMTDRDAGAPEELTFELRPRFFLGRLW